MKVSVEAKYRKRYPQRYLLLDAMRFYEQKDSEYLKTRAGKMRARLLALDGVLQQRGEAILTPGQRNSLLLAYQVVTPAEEVPEVRRDSGKETTQD